MANLSSLLNPPTGPNDPNNERSEPLGPSLQGDQQKKDSNGRSTSNGAAESPTLLQTITSPGLEALAAAASEVAPLVSPLSQDFGSNPKQTVFSGHETGSLKGMQSQGFHSDADQIQDQQSNVERERALDTSKGSTDDDRTAPPQSSVSTSAAPAQASTSNSNLVPMYDNVQVKSETVESPIERESSIHVPHLQTEFSPSSFSRRVASPGTPLKNVTNSSPGPAPSEEPSVMAPKRKGPPAKKRAAPKKGTAVKPPAKKRKVDGDNSNGLPSGPRISTPATNRASNTPGPKGQKGTSATPTRSSSVMNGVEDGENEEEEEDEDDNVLYCICRKPDDHSVMIGCDGPCGDWFHTRCVDMNSEKVDLIFKWYCPNCSAQGHETLWRRKCRLEDCNRPARADQDLKVKSKYCSDEHGIEFMRRRIFDATSEQKPPSLGNRKKSKNEDHIKDAGMNDDDYEHPRGGVLRPEELKALIMGVKDLAAFKRLGDRVVDSQPNDHGRVSYTADETVTLEAIDQRRKDLNARQSMLLDRDKLVAMIAARGKSVLAVLKEKEKSLKDICGYDARLTWTDDEFNNWRASEDGQHAFRTEVLPPPSSATDHNSAQKTQTEQEAEEAEIGPGVCKKKRCERHRAWFKLQNQDNAMEKDQVRQALRKLEVEERDIRDRATIRSLETPGS